MIAPPRAGKSTFAKNWVATPEVKNPHEVDENDGYFKFTIGNADFIVTRPRVVVCGDDFRKAVHGHAYIKEAEELVFANMTTACRALLNTGHDVLVDETNSTLTSIYRLLLVDIDAIPIWLDYNEEDCVRRATETGKAYLELPIRRICSQIRELKTHWPNNFNELRQKIIDRKTSDAVAV